MSLRWRIALALAAVGLITTVAVGFVTFRSTENRLIAEIDQSIRQTSVLLTARSGGPQNVPERALTDVYAARRIGPDGEIGATSFEVEVPLERDVLVQVIDERGVEVWHTEVASTGERFRIHTIGLQRGAFEVARSLDETDRVLDDLRRRTIVLVLLAALAAALVGAVIADRVARPLRRLAIAADGVRTTGRLDVPVPEVPGRDEVGRLGSAFGSMLVALRRSRDEQERLVQDAGHELRTPLTSLRTNLSVLRRHQDMPADMRTTILDDLDGEITELTDLVNELVAAASGGLGDHPPEPVDLVAVVRSVTGRVQRRRDREINLVETPDGEPPFVHLAPPALERALTNLVENACKFDGSDAPIEVAVRWSTAADTVEVRVADRGPGIPPEDLPRVFDRFHRSAATRTMPGSGLGLSIVRDVVESAGGRVVAENRPEGGAVVGFDLPLHRP